MFFAAAGEDKSLAPERLGQCYPRARPSRIIVFLQLGLRDEQ